MQRKEAYHFFPSLSSGKTGTFVRDHSPMTEKSVWKYSDIYLRCQAATEPYLEELSFRMEYLFGIASQTRNDRRG